MEWLSQNLVLIIFYVFMLLMFARFFYSIYINIKKENGDVPSDELPDCSLILAQYLLKQGELNKNSIKATFISLCKKGYITLIPMTNDKDNIYDFELIKNGIPNFEETEYEDNLFSKDFEDSDIDISDLYIFNNYIFPNKEKNTYSEFIKKLENMNIEEDLLLLKIVAAQTYTKELIVNEDENFENIQMSEKGEELIKKVKGLRLYLKKYDFDSNLDENEINIWGDYLSFAIIYNLEDLSLQFMNTLYVNKYFK